MWIFTTDCGFLSVVNARQGKGEPGQPVDPDRVMVRVRNREHLNALRARFEALGASPIIETPGADYPARIIVPKDLWVDTLADLAASTTYDNFKSAASRSGDSAYQAALHDIWTRMVQYQGRV